MSVQFISSRFMYFISLHVGVVSFHFHFTSSHFMFISSHLTLLVGANRSSTKDITLKHEGQPPAHY